MIERNKLPQYRAYQKAHQNTPHRKRRVWSNDLLRDYGITAEDYDAMFSSQGGTCAICKRSQTKRLHVDHDHSTGAVRGLLCRACNTAIGMFEDDTERLRNAITYLEAS